MDKNNNFTIKPKYCGNLEGHSGSVTSIVTGHSMVDGKENDILVSGSRDKTLLIWKINHDVEHNEDTPFGEPFVSLTGHNHFISDLSLSSDQIHLLSSSWDKSLRLWSLKTGKCVKRFSHPGQKEILSTAFSADGRQVFSSGSDNKLSLWNTKGEFVTSSEKNNHTDWVSKIKYSQSAKNKFYASVGWDGHLKIWSEFFKLSMSVKAHEGPIYALAISYNGSYIATGGKDQVVRLWKVGEFENPCKEFKLDSNITDLAFHPEMQWIAVASENHVSCFEIMGENDKPFSQEKPVVKEKHRLEVKPKFTSVAWSRSGKYLYAGATDAIIRVYYIDINNESA